MEKSKGYHSAKYIFERITVNYDVYNKAGLNLNEYFVIRLLLEYCSKASIAEILNISYQGISKIEKKLIDKNILIKQKIGKELYYKYGNQFYLLTT